MAIKLGSPLAVANNNPGNLRFAGQEGAIQGEGGFAKFQTPEAGYEALKNQIKLDASRGHTLQSFINKYAPPTENNTGEYITQATKNLGANPNEALSNIDFDKTAKFMAQKESSSTVESKYEVKFENGKTVTFDSKPTPQDIEEVAQKMGINKTADATNTENSNQPQQEGIIPSIIRGITQPVATMLARPVQAVAQLAGASNEDINKASAEVPFFGQGGRLDLPTGTFDDEQGGKDIVKAAGQGLQTASLGMPAGKIGQAVAMSAVSGLGSGLEQDQTVKSGLLNAAIGAGGGLIGGSISKALESGLPKWFTTQAFPKATSEQVASILKNKTIGTTKNLLEQSTKHLDNIGAELKNIIKAVPDNKVYTAQEILNNAAKSNEYIGQQFQNMGIDLKEAKKLLKANTTQTGLVDKFFDKGLNLNEFHDLNSSLGRKIYATDSLTTKAKQFGDLLYGPNTQLIQSTDSRLPELFANYSEERGINKILTPLAKKSGGSLVKYNDIMPFLVGSSAGGPLGGISAAAGMRILNKPSTQFAIGKTLQEAGKVASPVLNRTGLLTNLLKIY